MAMSMESGHGRVADINVTPMIDILLVLLIIFMVIVPQIPDGVAATLPRTPDKVSARFAPESAVVVQVLGRAGQNPLYKINGTQVAFSELLPKLTQIYANRAERVMFVKGDEGVDFQYIASVIDIGRAADVDRVGLITPETQPAQ